MNGPFDAAEAERLLGVMAAKLGDGHDDGRVLSAVRDRGGVAALAHPRRAGRYQLEDRLIAYEGDPRCNLPGFEGRAHGPEWAAALGEAHRSHGDDLLNHLHGPFALAILEPAKRRALLAIDRLGIRPLAFAPIGAQLVFGSRLDALAAYPGFAPTLDPQALFSYLYFHQIPSPQCIFRGVQKLRPAERIIVSDSDVRRELYWEPNYDDSAAAGEGALAAALRSQLEESVRHCLDDRPTGSFLSGGLDSSTVTGYLAKVSGEPVDAYAIGFDAKGYDEMSYARASARHFEARLHEHYVTPDEVVKAVPLIASAYDEPFGNASAVPTYYCARMAREDGKQLLLAGDGGDEIFAGNARYARQEVLDFYQRVPRWLRGRVVEPLALRSPAASRIAPLRKLRSYVEQAITPMPARLEAYNFLHREPLSQLLHPDFLAAVDPDLPLRQLGEVYERAHASSMLKRTMHLDLKFTLADNDLRKVSRMGELAGVDVGYPMLDEPLVALAAHIPSRLLLKRLQLRSFYRRTLQDFLAPETLAKQKHGFGLPFGLWMAEHRTLQELAYQSLDALKRRDILKKSYLDDLFARHRDDHAAYYGVMVWLLMVLEQWLISHGH